MTHVNEIDIGLEPARGGHPAGSQRAESFRGSTR